MAYLEELLPEFRKGAKIRIKDWGKSEYICIKDGRIIDEYGVCYNKFYYEDITSDEWEFYKEPEPDWDYIIKNKCLCWFWDDKFNWAICGTLGKIEKGAEYGFIMLNDSGNRSPYKNCRPVRRDEVTFYEDKKD